MKTKFLLFVILVSSSLFAKTDSIDSMVDYDSTKAGPISDQSEAIRLQELPVEQLSSHSVLNLHIGRSTLNNLRFSNEYYDFYYPPSVSSMELTFGWETTPLSFYGRWGFRVDLGYQRFKQSQDLPGVGLAEYWLHMFEAGFGGVYLFDFSPISKWIMVTTSVGASYHPFFQTGDLDGVQANDGQWVLYKLIGIRHKLDWMGWEQTSLSLDYKINSQIGDATTGMDLSGESLLFGITTEL